VVILAALFSGALAGGVAYWYRIRGTITVLFALAVWPTALIAGAIPAVFAGAFTAAWGLVAIGWEVHDRRRGGVVGQLARERVGLERLLAAPVVWWWTARNERVGELMIIGRRAHVWPLWLPMGRAGAGVRLGLFGSSGGGKSSLVALIVRHCMRRVATVLVLDGKGDRGLRRSVLRGPRERGRPRYGWWPGSRTAFDLLGGQLTVDERIEVLMAGTDYSGAAEHFRIRTEELFREVLFAMRACGRRPTLGELAATASEQGVRSLLPGLTAPGPRDRLAEWLASRDAAFWRDASPGVERVTALARGDLGEQLDPNGSLPAFDIDAALAPGAVTYIGLHADRFPSLARKVAASSLQQVLAAIDHWRDQADRELLIVVDEAGPLGPEAVERLMSRARDAGVSVLVTGQTFEPFQQAGVQGALLSGLTALVAFQLANPDDRELVAEFCAGRPGWGRTEQEEGGRPSSRGTRTAGYELAAHPLRIAEFGVGECLVFMPGEHRRLRIGFRPVRFGRTFNPTTRKDRT
jgi:hypothetical protein